MEQEKFAPIQVKVSTKAKVIAYAEKSGLKHYELIEALIDFAMSHNIVLQKGKVTVRIEGSIQTKNGEVKRP